MRKVELLQELKENMNKATNIRYICIFNDKKIIEIEDKEIIELDDIELINDIVNCDTCQLYDYTRIKKKSINGYLESMIVINKLNLSEYKIDIYMKKMDLDSCIEFEDNKQYKIILKFK